MEGRSGERRSEELQLKTVGKMEGVLLLHSCDAEKLE